MTRRRPFLIPVLLLLVLACGCTIDKSLHPGRANVHTTWAAPSPSDVRPDSLLVVSYNIQFSANVEGALEDLHKIGLFKPDILLLQEMAPEGVDTIAHALGLNAVYQPAAIHPHHQQLFGNAILTPWPVIDHDIVILPHPHPWSGQDRIAVACDLDIAGQPVRAISLHFATAVVAADQRLEQAAAVLDTFVTGWDGPVVIGGDFNTSTKPDIQNLRKLYRHREDVLPVHLPQGCTVRWNIGRPLGAGCRLDHIFLRGLRAGSSGIGTRAVASDHYPIWARVGWDPAP